MAMLIAAFQIIGFLLLHDELNTPPVQESCTIAPAVDQAVADPNTRVRLAEAAAREAVLRQYRAEMALAQLYWQQGRLDSAVALLKRHRTADGEDDHRGIEWHLLWRLTHAEQAVLVGHANPVKAIEFSADGAALISGDSSHTYATSGEVRIWQCRNAANNADQHSVSNAAVDDKDSASTVLWTQEAIKTDSYTYFSGVQSLALSPDGALVAVTDGQVVRVLSRADGQIKWTLEGHTDYAHAVAFSPDGKTLASGGLDKTIRLWNSETGKLVTTLSGQTLGVQALAFSPDGRTLAAGGGDSRAPDWSRRQQGELSLWDLENTESPQTIKVAAAVSSVAYSADRRWLAVGLFDGTTVILNVKDLAAKHTLKPSSAAVGCVRFAPDSQSLATASADGVVRLWDVDSGAEVANFRGHRGSVDCLAFSQDGRTLASGGSDRTIRVWDTASHPERTRIRLPAWSIHDVAFTPDSRSLIASDYRHVWRVDARTNRIETAWPIDHWTFATAISPNGSLIATAGEREPNGGGGAMIQLWNLEQGTKYADLPASLDSVVSAAFSPDGKFLAGLCRSRDRTELAMKLWDVASGTVIGTWPNGHQATFSPSNRWIAVAIASRIVLFEIDLKKTVAVLNGDAQQVHALQFSPDGTRLASSGEDKTVKLWDIESREVISVLQGQTQSVEQLLFTPDGLGLLAADSSASKFWNLVDGTERFTLSEGNCPMTFTPDGRTLITAPGEVHFWHVATGDELLTYPHYGYDSRCLAISADGTKIAQSGGNRDETNGVWVWNAGPPDP